MAKTIRNVLFYGIAAFYVMMMLELFFRLSLFFMLSDMFDPDRIVARSYNLIPFKTIGIFLGGENLSWSYSMNNILGNIAVFIPYGLYLQVIKKDKVFLKSLLVAAITSIAIEIIQYASGLGAGDIDDVLLNTCGGIIGILGYKLLRKVFRDESRTKTAITAMSVIVGAPVIFSFLHFVFARALRVF